MTNRTLITIYKPDATIHTVIENPVNWGMDKETPTLLRIALKDEDGNRKFIRTTLPFIVERWGEE